MDERVLEVQQWLNVTYGSRLGFGSVEEDGYTGWDVVYGLIRALQLELGITEPVNSFGPTTESKFNSLIGTLKAQTYPSAPTNLNYILQGAFFCKGYNPGGFTGNFYDGTEQTVKDFQLDIGIDMTGEVSAKVMKALLNTDGYRWNWLQGGKMYIRSIQQTLNKDYAYNSTNGWLFDYIPTDGIYGRATNKALIYALQVEEGIGHIANGNFGPSTWTYCPDLREGQTGSFIKLLQWALACNGEDYVVDFNGVYDVATKEAVSRFQEFMALSITGIADRGTIKQTMTTNGDTTRSTTACDASTIIDQNKATTFKQNGYKVIGRYLTGYVGTGTSRRSKAMTPEELQIIFANGLRVFPIYQDGGYYKDYFVKGKGEEDAFKAIAAANRLGFPSGTTIYFAVDFDAYDFEVTDFILPYFREIRRVFDAVAQKSSMPNYQIGIYGARNTCIRCAETEGIRTSYSFVSDMSTGFSGNLGYPMPLNWSFDQFVETSIGSGDGYIGIDKCGYSGRDIGVLSVNPQPTTDSDYLALLDEWIEIGTKLPFLSLYFPEIFSTEFVFDTTRVLGVINNVRISVTTQTGTITLGDDIPVFQVTNGKLVGITTEELLGESFKGAVEIDAFSQADNILKDLTKSIEIEGKIGVKVDTNGYKIEFKIVDESIPVEATGHTLKLGVLLVLEIIPTDPDSGQPDYSFVFDTSLELQNMAILLYIILLLLGLTAVPA